MVVVLITKAIMALGLAGMPLISREGGYVRDLYSQFYVTPQIDDSNDFIWTVISENEENNSYNFVTYRPFSSSDFENDETFECNNEV